jgi:hypothetical protein
MKPFGRGRVRNNMPASESSLTATMTIHSRRQLLANAAIRFVCASNLHRRAPKVRAMADYDCEKWPAVLSCTACNARAR